MSSGQSDCTANPCLKNKQKKRARPRPFLNAPIPRTGESMEQFLKETQP